MIKSYLSRENEEYFRYSTLPLIKENLSKFKNIHKLNLDPKEVFKQAFNESRSNLSYSNPFNFNTATIFTHDYKSLKRCAKYIFILDKLLGKFLKQFPNSIRRTGQLFMNNFADFGLMLSFVDFCIRRKIKLIKFEPENPSQKDGQLDFTINIKGREILVECFSPIESLIKGKSLTSKITNEIKSHKLNEIKQPIIFVINITEPSWSGNGLNRGYISDNMFFRIKYINNFVAGGYQFPNISAILIKYANRFDVFINHSTLNSLTCEEIDKLCKPFLLQRLLKFF